MSDFVGMLRSVKRGPSPSHKVTGSFGSPQREGMRSPYPTTPSKPWVPGSSLSAKRGSRGINGPRSGPYSANASAPTSTSSFSNGQGNSASQGLFSSPEPPFQIPDVVVISSTDNIHRIPTTDTASYTNSSADSIGPTTPASSYRRRPLSLRSKPLPPTPDAAQLQIPPFAHIGTRRHPLPSARPSTAPTPHQIHPESYSTSHYISPRQVNPSVSSDSLTHSRDRSWDPSLRAEHINPPTPPPRRLLAQKDQFRYDTPPPSYQILDALDNDLVLPSHDPKGSARREIQKHHHYFASKQVAGSIAPEYKTDTTLSSFLDMD